MDRRSFLRILAGAVPVAAVAPTYFFAPVGGWKSDVIVNPFQDRVDQAYAIIDNWMTRSASYNPDGSPYFVQTAYREFWPVHPAQCRVMAELGFKLSGGVRSGAMTYGQIHRT